MPAVTLRLTIRGDGAAFDADPAGELRRTLERHLERLEGAAAAVLELEPGGAVALTLRDVNGNRCGDARAELER